MTDTLKIANLHVAVEGQANPQRREPGDPPRRDARADGPQRLGQEHAGLAIMGHPKYEVTEGTIELNGENIARDGSRTSGPAPACSWRFSGRWRFRA